MTTVILKGDCTTPWVCLEMKHHPIVSAPLLLQDATCNIGIQGTREQIENLIAMIQEALKRPISMSAEKTIAEVIYES